MRVDAVQPCAAGSRNQISRLPPQARVGGQLNQERNEYPAGSTITGAHRFGAREHLPQLDQPAGNGRRDVGGGRVKLRKEAPTQLSSSGQ